MPDKVRLTKAKQHHTLNGHTSVVSAKLKIQRKIDRHTLNTHLLSTDWFFVEVDFDLLWYGGGDERYQNASKKQEAEEIHWLRINRINIWGKGGKERESTLN